MEGTRSLTPPRQSRSSIPQSKYTLTPAGKSYIDTNEDECTFRARGISYSGNLSLVEPSDSFIILSALPEYFISTIGYNNDLSEWGPRWLSNRYIFLKKVNPMISIDRSRQLFSDAQKKVKKNDNLDIKSVFFNKLFIEDEKLTRYHRSHIDSDNSNLYSS